MVDELLVFRNSVSGVSHKITDNVIVNHPTLNEICELGEQTYYGMTSLLCSNASHYKVFLWDNGTDWTQVEDYDFFCIIYKQLSYDDTRIILENLDFSKLHLRYNTQTNDNVLGILNQDGQYDIVIDRAIYMELVEYVRKMHGFINKADKPSNAHTKKYMIERERKRLSRQKKEETKSMLRPLISALVNNSNFKYNYSTVWDITISALTDAVHRVQKLTHYLHTMQGVYAGTVAFDKIPNKEDLNWLS